MKLKQWFHQKRAVFITTKNLDYIRNVQELNLLKENALEWKVIGSGSKKYPVRMAKVIFDILRTDFKKYDVVFIGFAPQLILPFFYFKFKKTDIIIDFFISMYDTMVFDRRKFKQNSLMAKILLHFDKKTLKLADKVIADTKAHGKYFTDELKCRPDKIEVLYLEADADIYFPVQQRKKDFTAEPFTVLYFGSILPLQGVEVVLKAVDLLKDRRDIEFELIGPIRNMEKPVSPNIHYYEWLDQKELAKKIGEADLCLAGHFSSEIAKAKRTIPGKAYIYHAMEKEMILGDGPANHELFSQKDGAYFVEMGNAKALADKIQHIVDSKKER